MTDRELMQMALNALEAGVKISPNSELHERFRAALAQPEPEPVAWKYETPDYVSLQWKLTRGDWRDGTWTPLYTAPPQREWVGLTDEEIDDLWECIIEDRPQALHFALALETKLKAKNA